MNQRFKRATALWVAVVMVLALVPSVAFASTTEVQQNTAAGIAVNTTTPPAITTTPPAIVLIPAQNTPARGTSAEQTEAALLTEAQEAYTEAELVSGEALSVSAADLQAAIATGGKRISLENATIILSADVLRSIIAQGGNNFEITATLDATEKGAIIDITVTSGGESIYTSDAEFIVHVALDLEALDIDNHHRIVAVLEDGTLVGGSYDPATGLFVFETDIFGKFVIEYVETLTRFTLQIGNTTLSDLAGNSGGTRAMDVAPVEVGGRTLVPVRFMSYALGADIDFNDTTRQVSITLNGRTISMGIDGQLDANLTALGMDVPAQIVNGRTMVPTRFILEFFDALVDFDPATREISVIKL